MARNKGKIKTTKLGSIFLYLIVVLIAFQIFLIFVYSPATGTDSFQAKFGQGIEGLIRHSGVSGSSSTVGQYSKLPLNEEGYNKMLEWDRTLTLTEEQKKQFAGFNVRLPCCGFGITSEDEKNDCRCGHHIATAGLIKYGLINGWTREQIQFELDQWKPIYYPECLTNKALCDLQ